MLICLMCSTLALRPPATRPPLPCAACRGHAALRRELPRAARAGVDDEQARDAPHGDHIRRREPPCVAVQCRAPASRSPCHGCLPACPRPQTSLSCPRWSRTSRAAATRRRTSRPCATCCASRCAPSLLSPLARGAPLPHDMPADVSPPSSRRRASSPWTRSACSCSTRCGTRASGPTRCREEGGKVSDEWLGGALGHPPLCAAAGLGAAAHRQGRGRGQGAPTLPPHRATTALPCTHLSAAAAASHRLTSSTRCFPTRERGCAPGTSLGRQASAACGRASSSPSRCAPALDDGRGGEEGVALVGPEVCRARGPHPLPCLPSLLRAQGVSGVENVLTQHQPLLVSLLDQLAKGRLPKAAFPYVGAEPSVRVSSVIVFIVGGVTFEEAAKVGSSQGARGQGGARTAAEAAAAGGLCPSLPLSPVSPESKPPLYPPPPSCPADCCDQCWDVGSGGCGRACDGCWQRSGPPALPCHCRGHAGGWAGSGKDGVRPPSCGLAHQPQPTPRRCSTAASSSPSLLQRAASLSTWEAAARGASPGKASLSLGLPSDAFAPVPCKWFGSVEGSGHSRSMPGLRGCLDADDKV